MKLISKRVGWALAAAGGLVVAAAGCELPLPPPIFVVTTTADGNDADPGDGVCEMTVGAGDCSLRSAVQEADAGLGARLVLPAGEELSLTVADADGNVDLDIGSAITIDPVAPASSIVVASGQRAVDIAEGGSLRASGLHLHNARVAGNLVLQDGQIGMSFAGGTSLEISASGSALVGTTSIGGAGGPAVVANAGKFVSLHTSIRGLATATLIDTTGAGSTHLAATRLLRATMLTSGYYPLVGAPYCSGNPVESSGWNFSPTTDCNLTATGDIAGVSYGTGPGPIGTPTLFAPAPPDSPVLGAIPEGVLACGTTVPAAGGVCDIGWG